MKIRRKWFFWGATIPLLLVPCFLVWQESQGTGEDILRAGQPVVVAETSLSTDQPLFVFDNAYLDGRSVWLRRQFERDRRALATRPLHRDGTVTASVHREPFSTGPWLANLGEDLMRHRKETEEQAVEAEAAMFLPDVEPRHLLFLLATSGFQTAVEENDKLERQIFYPGNGSLPRDLEERPDLTRNQFLSRERWRRPFAKPTDVYFLNVVGRDGEVYFLISEAWRNAGDASHAAVRMSSGQYALMARDGGTLLHLHTFYSGQAIPPFLDGVAQGITITHYKKLLTTVARLARTWEPSTSARGWIEAQEW